MGKYENLFVRGDGHRHCEANTVLEIFRVECHKKTVNARERDCIGFLLSSVTECIGGCRLDVRYSCSARRRDERDIV
jgi:hypothetical protein